MKCIPFAFLLLFTPYLSSILSGQSHPTVALDLFKSGFNAPVGLTNAGDGSGRLFVVEKGGRIKIIKNGNTLPTPFLDISGSVSSGGEQGLLGLVFHPNYSSNGYFYVNYTDLNGDTHIARFTRDPNNPDKALSNSQLLILFIDQPGGNHNAGALQFGLDGYLYIGTGDGGGGGDPDNYGQTPNTLLGKMLRIDVNTGNPYSIPSSNPYVGDPTTRDEIWAMGLRNPWQFSIDKATGDLWIGDVGQDARGEINRQPGNSEGGENYGWRCYEGTTTFNTSGCDEMSSYTFPVFEVFHSDGGNSITGGHVYRGPNPCLNGVYFCAEFRQDILYTILPNGIGWSSNSTSLPDDTKISAFGEDESKNLYAVSYEGSIFKIIGGEVMTLHQNPIPPGTYTSHGIIESRGAVGSGTVETIAAEFIELMSGFEVVLGATFIASISCE